MRDSDRQPGFTAGLGLFRPLCLAVFVVLVAAPSGPGAGAWAQSNPVPLINQPLVPDAVAPGGLGFTLTVNGTDFVSGSVVQWNGAALATTFVSSAQLTAAVPASDIATAGTASVTVNNGTPETTSAPVFFPVTQPTAGVGFGQSSFGVGVQPAGEVAADLNGDGKLDLVVANFDNFATSTISVLLGNGDGTFQPQVQYPAGSGPMELVAGDFNGDGNLDLAVLSYTGITVLMSNGDGTFQPPLAQNTFGSTDYEVATADFNGDGKLDLAVTLYPNQVAILLGNGDGTFQNPSYFTAGTYGPLGMAIGDFNRDGNLDLAVGVRSDFALAILLGNGDGTFQNYIEYPGTGRPTDVVAADFNGDGNLDLALAAEKGIDVFLGNGDGTFQSAVPYSTLDFTALVVAADFNGDGKLDLASGGEFSPVFVLLGRGDGTFQTSESFPLTGGRSYNPGWLAVGDFNSDGRVDLATDSFEFNAATVLLQVTSVVSPTAVNFGKVKVGTKTAPVPITLSNTGQTAFTVTTVELSGGEKAYFSETNNCLRGRVPAGGSCTIKVAFKPPNTGLFAATLTVKDSADNSPQFVNVGGTGVQ